MKLPTKIAVEYSSLFRKYRIHVAVGGATDWNRTTDFIFADAEVAGRLALAV